MAGAIRTLFGEIFFKDKASKPLDDVNKKIDDSKKKALGLDSAIAAIGGMAFISSVKGMVGSMIDAASEFEQTSVSMEVMTGSMETAKKLVEDLDAMALKTPFEASDLNRNATLLLNFGSAVDDILPSLQMLGDISGGNANKLNSLSLVFAQVKSQGKLMGQDLLQMINAGFNPLQTMSEATGESMSSLKDKMSKGQISFDMVRGAMEKATSEGGRFYKMMDKQSMTWAGLTSSIDDMQKKIMKAFGDVIINAVKPILPYIIDLTMAFVAFAKTERGIAMIKTVLIALFILVSTVGVASFYALAVAVNLSLWWLLLIVVAVTAVILIFEDLYKFFTGGKSLFGRYFIDPIKRGLFSLYIWFKELPDRMIAGIRALPGMIGDLLIGLVPDWVIKLITTEEETKPKTKRHGRGHRASGGPVTSGNPYVVGEQGEELFIPNSNGSIIPNNKLSAGGKLSIASLVGTINIYANNSKEAASKFESEIMKVLDKLSKNIYAAELGINI